MESENPPQSRNVKTHMAKHTVTFPEEIIEEILLRLPVKSILKFRCVSKSWCSLIDSKRFIKIHLQNSTKNTTFVHQVIITRFAFAHPKYRLRQCSLRSLLSEPAPYFSGIDYPFNIPVKSISLVGCCNGLVCIRIQRKYFYLWNPSTKMSKKLPDIHDDMKHARVAKYGFSFDEWNDDYKIFGIVSVLHTGTGLYQAIGSKIYSLKNNSWRMIKERDDFHSQFHGAGKFASGRLHWKKRDGHRWEIVSFDLKSEVYGMVAQPGYSEGGFHLLLGVLGGCLSLLCDYQTTHLDVWVMKQYGVKESWDKLVTVPHNYPLESLDFSLVQFAIGPNGEVLLTYRWTLVIYYHKENVFRCPLTLKFGAFDETDLYIESLVSVV